MFFLVVDNKLQQRSQINLQNKKKKSHQKKITGFQVIHLRLLLFYIDLFSSEGKTFFECQKFSFSPLIC